MCSSIALASSPLGSPASFFFKIFQKEGVIVLAASVVSHGRPDIFRNFVQVQQQLLERHFLDRFRRLGECFIQVFDVSARCVYRDESALFARRCTARARRKDNRVQVV